MIQGKENVTGNFATVRLFTLTVVIRHLFDGVRKIVDG